MTECKTRLQGLPFWERLTDTEKNLTENAATIRRYDKGNIIHATEGDCLGMAVVPEGC